MERSNAAKDAGKPIPNVSNNENGNTKQAKLLRLLKKFFWNKRLFKLDKLLQHLEVEIYEI